MKKARIVLMGALLMIMTVGVFSFKANKKFTAATDIYLGATGSGPLIAAPNGHWYEDNNGGAAGAASLNYGSNSNVTLTYDQTNQIFFQP